MNSYFLQVVFAKFRFTLKFTCSVEGFSGIKFFILVAVISDVAQYNISETVHYDFYIKIGKILRGFPAYIYDSLYK